MSQVAEARPVAIVTGASRGIGRGIAHSLARRRYALTLVSRSSDALSHVAAELRACHTPVIFCKADVGSAVDRRQLVEKVRNEFGRCDCLIHNAGQLGRGLLAAASELTEQVVNTNLIGPIELTRLLLSDLSSTGGSIVFVASTAGRVAFPYMSRYCASKHGLVGFAESVRYELGEQGIHVM